MTELTEVEKDQYFIDLWMGAIRNIYKNEYLRPPKEGSTGYKHLVKARQIADKMGGEYSDYIKCQISALSYVHVKPMPFHLATDNAKKRFKRYQVKYNKFIHPAYVADGDSFLVTATGKRYPIRQVESASSTDEIASKVLKLLEVSEDGINSLTEERRAVFRDEAYYFEAKAFYNGRIIPEGFRKLKNLLTGQLQQGQEADVEKVEDLQRVDELPQRGVPTPIGTQNNSDLRNKHVRCHTLPTEPEPEVSVPECPF
jgi:hypothetical protein